MASREQLRKIAIYCDAYDPREDKDPGLKAGLDGDKYDSCENCRHFTREGSCDLDLIDQVLSSLAMELDLKR